MLTNGTRKKYIQIGVKALKNLTKLERQYLITCEFYENDSSKNTTKDPKRSQKLFCSTFKS